MWVRYQQVSSKMASFDPREMAKNKEEHLVKHPLKRFEPTLRTSLKIAIPTNLDRLRKHRNNIEKYASSKKWKELNMEQINASRTVQQLKATIRELDKVKNQLVESDVVQFQNRIAPMKEEAINSIKDFGLLHNVISNKIQKSLSSNDTAELSDDPLLLPSTSSSPWTGMNSSDLSQNFSGIDQPSNSAEEGTGLLEDGEPLSGRIQIQDHQRDQEEIAASQSWDHLRNGLVELNTLVKDFASVVYGQQETIDQIEDNVEQAHENVRAGTGFLAQASKYKAAAIPVAGAIIGGIIGGPIGLMAGFKLAGLATAVGGGVAGYQGGKFLKNKHDTKVEMELDNLSTKDDNTRPTEPPRT